MVYLFGNIQFYFVISFNYCAHMFLKKKKYFFIIESIKDIQLKHIKNFGKFSIIYRNNIEENIDKLKRFRLECN